MDSPLLARLCRQFLIRATPGTRVVPAQQHCRDCLQKKKNVEPEALAFDVLNVKQDLTIEGNLASPAYLPNTSESWLAVEPPSFRKGISRDFLR